MPSLPRAILFDLDDTILTIGGREALLLEVVQESAGTVAPIPVTELAADIEAAMLAFWAVPGRYAIWRMRLREARIAVVERLFAERRARSPQLSPELAERIATRFHDVRENGRSRLFPGAVATIEELRRRGVKLALVTNGHGDSQRAKIDAFDLARLFDHVQIEGEQGFGKPEERAYTHAMAALGVEPSETWMVGDHLEWEVAAPQRLGIYGIWHDPAGKGLPPDSDVVPDRIVRSIPELLL
ncbi:HAD family hydrolase [bacterium]|nr:MAG: HAD family hydrolase [bacterium]